MNRLFFLLFFLGSAIMDVRSQTFLNGSFENNTAGSDQINISNATFNSLMANTVAFGTFGDMDIITSATYCGLAQSGSWYTALTGSGTDAITMQLSAPLIAGNNYTICFWDKGCNAFSIGSPPVQIGLSSVAGAMGTVIYTGPAPTNGTWVQRTFTFSAPINGQFISVQLSSGGLSSWTQIDNFSFTCGSNNPPVASFNASDTLICPGTCIDFTDFSSNSPTSWNWTFTGGTPSTSTAQNPTSICYASSGNYSVSLTATNAFGSGSVTYTGYITVAQTYTISETGIICSGNTFTYPDGTTTTIAGSHTSNLTTVAGCDSIINTTVCLSVPVSTNNPQTICSGQIYSFNTHNYTLAGTYYDTLQTTGGGCDSIIVTQLTVNPVYSVNNPQSICIGSSYTFNSHVYSAAGTYYDTLATVSNCDSIIVTQLTVNPIYSVNNPQQICSGGSYTINGHGYITSGTYQDTLTSVSGCDSIIITQLIVNPVYSVSIPQSICSGQVYSFNSHSYITSGTYTDTLFSINGCDSIIITDLTVIPLPSLTYTEPSEVCIDDPPVTLNNVSPSGGSYSGIGVNDQEFNPQEGMPGLNTLTYSYTDPITGCFNSLSFNITVNPLPEVFFTSDPHAATLNAPEFHFIDFTGGAQSWLWNFGDNSESDQYQTTHYYSDTGTYAISLYVTDTNGCDNSALDTVYVGPGFIFYVPSIFSPNGDGKNDLFSGLGSGIAEYDMMIYDRWGNRIYETKDYNKPWDGGNAPCGVYIYKIKLKDHEGAPHEFVGNISVVK